MTLSPQGGLLMLDTAYKVKARLPDERCLMIITDDRASAVRFASHMKLNPKYTSVNVEFAEKSWEGNYQEIP